MSDKLPNRQTLRLRGYDYSSSGWYFVTICTENRVNLFGEVVGAWRDAPDEYSMRLSEYGLILDNVLKSVGKHHPVNFDIFQIMPNHVHLVIRILDKCTLSGVLDYSRYTGASRRAPTSNKNKPTLGWIVGIIKTTSTHAINILRNTPSQKIFQRNYYEHIIRNENELWQIRQYIKDNPKNWIKDELFNQHNGSEKVEV